MLVEIVTDPFVFSDTVQAMDEWGNRQDYHEQIGGAFRLRWNSSKPLTQTLQEALNKASYRPIVVKVVGPITASTLEAVGMELSRVAGVQGTPMVVTQDGEGFATVALTGDDDPSHSVVYVAPTHPTP